MGMIGYNPLKNAASTLKSIFKNAPAQTPQQGNSLTNSLPGVQQNIPGYDFNPYQIQSGDTFESIAQKNNLPGAGHIQDANNGMLVPPPTGSFINIPKLAQAQSDYYNRNNSGANAPVGYGPYWQNRNNQLLNNPQTAPNPTGYQTNSFTGPNGQVNTAELIANIQNSPEAPTVVPGGVLSSLMINGAPATPQAMQASGYTFNQATQSWVLNGSQAAQTAAGGNTPASGNNWMTNPALHMITYNRNAKNKHSRFQTNLKWAMNAWKRKRRGPQQQVAGPESTANPGGSGGPSTVLDLHLGSG